MSEPLHIIRSNRRTLALEVNDQAEIVVRSPRSVDEQTIHNFVASKARWIKKQLAKILKQGPRAAYTYKDGELLLYLGEHYPLRLVSEQRSFYFNNGFFLSEIQHHRAKEIIINWYKKEAKKHLQARTKTLAARHHLAFRAIRITGATTRWGSCGHRGTLNFSWRIIMAPPAIIDYVISHELAHLSIKNHSQKFWQHVKEICPAYEAAHQWLKDHGSRLKL